MVRVQDTMFFLTSNQRDYSPVIKEITEKMHSVFIRLATLQRHGGTCLAFLSLVWEGFAHQMGREGGDPVFRRRIYCSECASFKSGVNLLAAPGPEEENGNETQIPPRKKTPRLSTSSCRVHRVPSISVKIGLDEGYRLGAPELLDFPLQ